MNDGAISRPLEEPRWRWFGWFRRPPAPSGIHYTKGQQSTGIPILASGATEPPPPPSRRLEPTWEQLAHEFADRADRAFQGMLDERSRYGTVTLREDQVSGVVTILHMDDTPLLAITPDAVREIVGDVSRYRQAVKRGLLPPDLMPTPA